MRTSGPARASRCCRRSSRSSRRRLLRWQHCSSGRFACSGGACAEANRRAPSSAGSSSSVSTARTRHSPIGSWNRGCCRTSRSSRRRAAIDGCGRRSRRCRRSPGRRSAPAPSQGDTTSSISSTATGEPTCPCCRRRTSAASSGTSGWDATGYPAGGPSCACCASPSRSGPCWANTVSGARSSVSRSRFRPIASTAPS